MSEEKIDRLQKQLINIIKDQKKQNERVKALEQWRSGLRKVGREIYNRFKRTEKEIAELKTRIRGVDLNAMRRRCDIIEVLRDLQFRVELIAGYVLSKEQFKYIFNDEYWNTKKLKVPSQSKPAEPFMTKKKLIELMNIPILEKEPTMEEPTDSDAELWECPICHKDVMMGQMIHKGCLEEQISEFLDSFEKINTLLEDYTDITNTITIDIPLLIEKIINPEWKKWQTRLKQND